MRFPQPLLAIALLAPLGAFAATPAKDATDVTRHNNQAWLQRLPFADTADFEAAQRGLIERYEGVIANATGKTVWDLGQYAFLNQQNAPSTVNPSLWRMARLNTLAGLFQVTEGIYQIRGLDLANMTIVEGESGLIVLDPLLSVETARAGLELYFKHRPRKPVTTVIYTHPHVDHFGGVRAVVDEADVKAGKVQIIAPQGFFEHAIGENVLAGPAMKRRAQYMYGAPLPRSERGQVDAGLGKGVPANATVSLIAPTREITQPLERLTLEGIEVEFQLTPGTEAPAEMNIYFPRFKALCMAENATHVQHNVLTLRGALVRDPKIWAHYLDQSLLRYGDQVDVVFAQHHWPTWGGAQIRDYLADQRDMYAFLNDRTLHLLNQGLTPLEIAEAIKKLPGSLDQKWYTRGYYGSLSFNTRAVYQRYMGFYDGNPANLDPLPPEDSGRRYVAAMGGADAVLKTANLAFVDGDYRWAAQLLNHLVFAEPDNKDAVSIARNAVAEAKAKEDATVGLSEAQVMHAKAEAHERQGIVEATIIEKKADANKKEGLAEAEVIKEKALAEAAGININDERKVTTSNLLASAILIARSTLELRWCAQLTSSHQDRQGAPLFR